MTWRYLRRKLYEPQLFQSVNPIQRNHPLDDVSALVANQLHQTAGTTQQELEVWS